MQIDLEIEAEEEDARQNLNSHPRSFSGVYRLCNPSNIQVLGFNIQSVLVY